MQCRIEWWGTQISARFSLVCCAIPQCVLLWVCCEVSASLGSLQCTQLNEWINYEVVLLEWTVLAVEETSLLRRLQAQTLPDTTLPKAQPCSVIIFFVNNYATSFRVTIQKHHFRSLNNSANFLEIFLMFWNIIMKGKYQAKLFLCFLLVFSFSWFGLKKLFQNFGSLYIGHMWATSTT